MRSFVDAAPAREALRHWRQHAGAAVAIADVGRMELRGQNQARSITLRAAKVPGFDQLAVNA